MVSLITAGGIIKVGGYYWDTASHNERQLRVSVCVGSCAGLTSSSVMSISGRRRTRATRCLTRRPVETHRAFHSTTNVRQLVARVRLRRLMLDNRRMQMLHCTQCRSVCRFVRRSHVVQRDVHRRPERRVPRVRVPQWCVRSAAVVRLSRAQPPPTARTRQPLRQLRRRYTSPPL